PASVALHVALMLFCWSTTVRARQYGFCNCARWDFTAQGADKRARSRSPRLAGRRNRARTSAGEAGPGLEASHRAQLLGAVGALPGEVRLVPAKVAEGRRLRVDRAQQVKAGDDRTRPQVEHLG